MRDLLLSRLIPFKHVNYRRFFFVQSLSLVGKWSHDLARAWIVIEMFGRAGALGTLLLAVAVPSLLFILHGGVMVDRVNVKRLMILTKSFLAVASLGLAALMEYSQIEFWHLLIFGVIEGLIMAFDSPAYQALTVRLVPREDFQQALALNSMNFHAGRMLGPLVAGLLMAWYGPTLVFLFDGLSYFLLVFILSRLDLSAAKRDLSKTPRGRWRALFQGFKYIVQTPPLRYKILQLLMAISLLLPLMIVVFRTYVAEKFGLSAEQFGYIFTIPALGSMLGALSFAAVKPKRPIKALLVGAPLSALTMMLVPLAPTALLASLAMGVSGLAVYLSFASLTVSLHLDVEEEYRGRLGSVIGMGFLSLGPLASFPIGYLADGIGFNNSVYAVSALFLILSGLLAVLHWKQWEMRASPDADVSVWSGLKPR